MMTATVGDDIVVNAVLMLNDQRENVTGYTLKAAIVQRDKKTLAPGTSIVDVVILDAAAGLVSATWPRSTTIDIPPGTYYVEIQASIGGLLTTYERDELILEPGAIP